MQTVFEIYLSQSLTILDCLLFLFVLFDSEPNAITKQEGEMSCYSVPELELSISLPYGTVPNISAFLLGDTYLVNRTTHCVSVLV